MKNKTHITTVFILILLALGGFLSVIFKKASKQHTAPSINFDDSQEYIIVPNRPTAYQGQDIPEGIYYVVYKNIPEVLSLRDRTRPPDIKHVQFVGNKTSIDLTDYINQPVYLKTKDDLGQVLCGEEKNIQYSFCEEAQKVLIIEDLSIVR